MKPQTTAHLVGETVRAVVPSDEPQLGIEEVLEATIRLYRDLAIDPAAWESMSVRTLRFYRQEGILSAPFGRTSKARYGRRHVLEAAVARLAGHLHQVTLDAAAGLPDLSEDLLIARLAEMLELERKGRTPVTGALPLRGVRPLVASATPVAPIRDLIGLDVGHGATLLIPRDHPALSEPGRLNDLRERVEQALRK